MATFLCLWALAMVTVPGSASSKAHVISFGKWQLVEVDRGDNVESLVLRVRALLVDGKVKEYTVGQPHDVTERVFVMERAVRLNDALPDEKLARWIWQRGGWVQVDRSSSRITPLKLPDFDPEFSVASWYRDYVAYCGMSDDHTRTYAIIMQLGTRKPILRKALDVTANSASGNLLCRSPVWQRKPIRAEFNMASGPSLTFTLPGHVSDLTTAEQDDTE